MQLGISVSLVLMTEEMVAMDVPAILDGRNGNGGERKTLNQHSLCFGLLGRSLRLYLNK